MKNTPHFREETWYLNLNNGIEFRFMDSAEGLNPFKLHWHDYMELIYIIEGSIYITLDQDEMLLSENQLVIIPPKKLHAGTPHENGVKICSIFLDIESLTNKTFVSYQYLLPLLQGELDFLPTTKHPEILDKLYHLINSEKNSNPIYMQGGIIELIGLIFEYTLIKNKKTSSVKIKSILEYIQNHFIEDISAKKISKHFGYSESHFCRTFKKQMGITVSKHIQNIRIEYAKKLLLETDMEIRKIYENCGFADFSYFCRIFKSATGFSPSDFRKKQTARKQSSLDDRKRKNNL